MSTHIERSISALHEKNGEYAFICTKLKIKMLELCMPCFKWPTDLNIADKTFYLIYLLYLNFLV